MQLYYHPYACSLAPAIVAAEAGIALDLVHVDILGAPHRLGDGTDYRDVNTRNYVPLLVRDDGSEVSEAGIILKVLADLNPTSGLAPAVGSPERLLLEQWLTFLGTELHKSYSPWLFHPEVGATAQAYARDLVARRYAIVEAQLDGRTWLLGETFSVADAYLFVMVNWAAAAGTPLDGFPLIRAWFERMKARPKVREAIRNHSASPAAKAA
ncbi:MAG: glutathione S-transferase C-terminal domain-containing protein [Devosia sp.]|uniref:glutathione binding-like protein n=1 Tax=Devosia sp. TaxID=1871048 RepID=UPI001AC92277|nr:glutathione binding-like protein [Devosia sp.]MBN9317956.1 glutathione S-transferase C-terminal domain-containing protein [Devosia sp.]